MNDDYQAYLLRLRRTDNAQWRILLRDTQNGTSQHFTSDRDLLVHLLSLLRDIQTTNDPRKGETR